MRKGKEKEDSLIFICNFTPVVYYDFGVGVNEKGIYKEVFNSDNLAYGGSDQIMKEEFKSINESWNEKPYKVLLKVPPMAVLVIKKCAELIEDEKILAETLTSKSELTSLDENEVKIIDNKLKEEN